MESQQSSKTITEKIDKVRHEINKYGKLYPATLRKVYFCKKLNKEMRLYEEEIVKVKEHVLKTIQTEKIYKELYK